MSWVIELTAIYDTRRAGSIVHENATIEAELIIWFLTEEGEDPPLPRAGQKFELVPWDTTKKEE